MAYLGPLILIIVIWWLSVLELKKDEVQVNNLLFYKVISISFTVMLLFVLSSGVSSVFDFMMSLIVGLISIAVTTLICLPQDKHPTWYKEKLKLLDQYLMAKKAEETQQENQQTSSEEKQITDNEKK